MNSQNSQNKPYSSRKFVATNSHKPCPICDDIKGKCRFSPDNQDFILCMTYPHDAGLPTWKYLGETQGGYFAGKYVRKRNESAADRHERHHKYLTQRIAHQKAKREGLAKLPDASQRHHLYRTYLNRLLLNEVDNADLISRGLSNDDIRTLGAKSIKSGYILPICNPQSQILGFQVRLHNAEQGRYRWHKPFGISAHQQNGELPLAFYGNSQADCPRVVLVEGTGVKPYLASKLRNCAAIGASGGQFLASKKTLLNYLETIGAQHDQTRLEYAIDAGDIANPAVMQRHEKVLDFLQGLDFAIDILWWGQAAKTDDDIDELAADTKIELLDIDQFFQIANYQPTSKLKSSKFHWLQDKLQPKPSTKGFADQADKAELSTTATLPKKPRRSPQPFLSKFEYDSNSRLEAWQKSLLRHKHVLDTSDTGTGKSYDAGRLRPHMFDGIERIIYVSNDSRNVTTETLKDWELLPARHNGLTSKSGKLRRANSDDVLDTQANCSRNGAIAALRAKAITDTSIICETCPALNACRSGSGKGFGFKNQRAIAFKSNILRSHPASLPHPTEFDYSKTLLVWEEVSESLTTVRQITVNRDDVDMAIALLIRANIANGDQIINVLKKLYTLLGDTSYNGLNFHAIKDTIPEIIDTNTLAELLKPDLSILDTVNSIADAEFANAKGQEKRELARLNAALKRETTLSNQELEKKIDREIVKQWLVEFLNILSGAIAHGDLHIHSEKLTISLADPRLRDIAQKSAANLYLDATIDAIDLEMRLNTPVHRIKQSGNLVMPQIYQVPNIGRLGMQRSDLQKEKVEAIISHLTNLDPTTRVIDFKRFTKDATDRGVWFRDSRGSNDFKDAKTFVVVGTPCANIATLHADFVTMTGKQPADKDPDFAAFVDRHIFAAVQQCFGRKTGDRFNQGDQIYFLSDFDLGDIPHTVIQSGDITLDAMSNLELLQFKVTQIINNATDHGFDLLNASERQLCQFLGIKRGTLRYHFEWINSLLRSLYNKLIHSFDENLVNLDDHADIEMVNLWSDLTELFLSKNLPINETLSGIFEFFSEHIPDYLHNRVISRLSQTSQIKLFSSLSVSVIV